VTVVTIVTDVNDVARKNVVMPQAHSHFPFRHIWLRSVVCHSAPTLRQFKIAAERVRWPKLVKETGIKVQ